MFVFFVFFVVRKDCAAPRRFRTGSPSWPSRPSWSIWAWRHRCAAAFSALTCRIRG